MIDPVTKNIPVDQEKLRRCEGALTITLDQIERVFLNEHDYVCGDNITIADLIAISEVMQPWAAGFDVEGDRPKVVAWMNRVKERLQPHFDDVHQHVYHVRDTFGESQSIGEGSKV